MLKKITFVLFLFSLTASVLHAQKKRDILKMPAAESPIDESSKEVTYVLEFSNDMADSTIYKRSFHWYNSAIKSMRIQHDESTSPNKLVAKGEMDLLYPDDGKGVQAKAARLKYTMETSIQDHKVVTKIFRFNVQNTIYTPIEPWIKEQEEDYLKKFYLIYIEEQAEQILADYKEFVNVTVYKR